MDRVGGRSQRHRKQEERALLPRCSPKCCPTPRGRVSCHPAHTGNLCVTRGNWERWCWSRGPPGELPALQDEVGSFSTMDEEGKATSGARLGLLTATTGQLVSLFFFVLIHILQTGSVRLREIRQITPPAGRLGSLKINCQIFSLSPSVPPIPSTQQGWVGK